MAKINIKFNNADYQIDESALADATNDLKQYLSTTMSGTGATITLGGTSYNIDSTKLSTATSNFISHLGTIAGDGHKVVVGGIEYGVDSSKISGAISEIEAVLSGTGEERLEGDGAKFYTLAPTALSFRSTAPLNELQEVQINGVTVDPSNYTLEEGSTIVTFPIDYLKTLDVGNYEVNVVSDSKTVKGGFSVAAPELNEYGFYYNQPYAAYMDYFGSDVVMFIREDNTMDIMVVANDVIETAAYAVDGGTLTITSPSMGELHCTFSADGMELYNTEFGATLSLNENETYVADEDYFYIYKEDLGGYAVNCIDKTKTEYGAIRTNINDKPTVCIPQDSFGGCINLTSIDIPTSVTWIARHAFDGCKSLESITIGCGVMIIDSEVFRGCTNLTNIIYNGTVEQWKSISKVEGSNTTVNWNDGVPATYVQCSDGQVEL